MQVDVKPQPSRGLKTQIGPIASYIEAKDLLGDQYWSFWGIAFVGLLIGGAVPLVLLGPAFCGIGIVLLSRATGRQMKLDYLFKGFDYFAKSLIAALIYMGIVFCGLIPFLIGLFGGIALLASEEPPLMIVGGVMMFLGYVFWIAFVMIVPVIFFHACILIVDRNMEGGAAMKLALQGFLANFWGMIGLALVGQFIVMLGFMLCIVPGILLFPLTLAGQFIAYKKIFGIQTKPATPVARTVEPKPVYPQYPQ